MNKLNTFALVSLSAVIGFLAAQWSIAQPATHSTNATTDPYFAMDQLESFVGYLQDNNQTNILSRFNVYSDATIVSQMSADMGVTAAILMRVRDGRTNDVIKLLESRLTADAVGFSTSYRQLPVSIREKVSLLPLKKAREYCAKFKVKEHDAELDKIVANAFNLLDEKSSH